MLIINSFFVAAIMAYRGWKRQSLTLYGAVSALIVGFLSLSSGLRGGLLLLLFYIVGTKATKYKSEWKSKYDTSYSIVSSCRGPSQVLACSVIGVILQLVHLYWYGEAEQSIDFEKHPHTSSLACAIIAHHATSLADTLASELGIILASSSSSSSSSSSCSSCSSCSSSSKQGQTQQWWPILVTTGQRVPPGTNGGVTVMGTACSALGGFIIGLG
jgi:uncharacterized membrane protein